MINQEIWMDYPIKVTPELKQQAWQDHLARMEMGLGPKFMSSAQNLQSCRAHVQYDSQFVTIHGEYPTSAESLKTELLGLKPWRKGPFDFFGVQIQTEWDSSQKWDRLQDLNLDLKHKVVMDLGCGNGYYMMRMLEQNPRLVLGLDPSSLFHAQFNAIYKYMGDARLMHLAITSDQIESWGACCDVLFCMGVLYHRKSPIDFLNQLRTLLNPSGELVLETLILEGESDHCLCPYPAYAKMKNCYHIPTLNTLKNWLARAGFEVIKVGSTEWTTPSEQRASQWMDFQSLEDFLDPSDPTKTIEGYQAPLRVHLLARSIR